MKILTLLAVTAFTGLASPALSMVPSFTCSNGKAVQVGFNAASVLQNQHLYRALYDRQSAICKI